MVCGDAMLSIGQPNGNENTEQQTYAECPGELEFNSDCVRLAKRVRTLPLAYRYCSQLDNMHLFNGC
jgi:hypothetical protein